MHEMPGSWQKLNKATNHDKEMDILPLLALSDFTSPQAICLKELCASEV